ncbi:MAG: YwiC-like family protein, partial [Chloroflexi bacterium]|nr:YwiC-like family protein [Chloroflexota bacterium]
MSQRSVFRRSLILPAEHGSWSWLLVPYLLGAAVAGRFTFATLLVLLGGLSIFLMRQPATAWLRVRQGKGRRSDGPLAAGWTIGLGLLGVLSLAGLLALGHDELLLLGAPLALVMAAYLFIALQRRAQLRSLGME